MGTQTGNHGDRLDDIYPNANEVMKDLQPFADGGLGIVGMAQMVNRVGRLNMTVEYIVRELLKKIAPLDESAFPRTVSNPGTIDLLPLDAPKGARIQIIKDV